MFKNVATKIALFAFTPADGLPKTGDAAQLTAYVSKDYGAVTVLADTTATEMDATNAPGWYLFDVAQTESNADALLFTAKSSTSGVKIVGQYVFTTPNRFTTLVIDAAGLADANAVKVGPTGAGTAQTARDIGASVLLSNGTGAGQISLSSGAVLLQATQTGVTIPTVTTVTNQLTAAQVATGVWQDATAGDFTTASSIGKALYIANVAPGASGGHLISGSNAGTTTLGALTVTGALTANITGNLSGSVGSVSGSVGSVTGLTASNLDATISSRMATYTQPTGFLAATFPATVASTTNITAGTITTVTNLTNAPTAGDLTAVMKASVTTAATAATPTISTLGANAITAASIAADAGVEIAGAVWDEALAGHAGVGSAGAALTAAGSAGDPWTTVLPGAYGAGTAGAKIGSLTFTVANQIDANMQSINDVTITGTGVSPTKFGV
jgi:hypothetical protein